MIQLLENYNVKLVESLIFKNYFRNKRHDFLNHKHFDNKSAKYYLLPTHAR